MSFTVAIDGPAASGKTTVAVRIAASFGFHFLDTGLLYRAVGRWLLSRAIEPSDASAAVEAARNLRFEDVEAQDLRGNELGTAASKVAALPAVREALLPFQQSFALRPPGSVLAGRDVGTVVCPAAQVKLFVTASVEERSRRRFEELQRLGRPAIYTSVLEELLERDRRDTSRSVAPLRPADDAILLDTTDMTAEAAFAQASEHVASSWLALGAD